MSVLFSPIKIGSLEIPNRFIRSATCECMSDKNGELTDKAVQLYGNLAKGDVGLIISGHCFVHPTGKSIEFQTGVHSDNVIPGLKRVVDAVHKYNGRICFQLSHGGLQCSKDVCKKPYSPTKIRSPITFLKSKEMDGDFIRETIDAFVNSASRIVESGADAVELHAAHGYLINEFLSPFFNKRADEWGGNDENRFRFLKEIVIGIKHVLPRKMPLIVKISTNDYVKKSGITSSLAVKYAQWLSELKVDAIEVSCGTAHFSYMNIWRGSFPLEEILLSFPKSQRFFVKMVIKKKIGKYHFDSEYNLNAAKLIKPKIKDTKLILVGGVRGLNSIENIIDNNYADFVSMCRPFIMEPDLVKKFQNKTIDRSQCDSCNKCFVAITNYHPVDCYKDGIPKK